MIYTPPNAYPDPPRRGTKGRLCPLKKRACHGSSATSRTCGARLLNLLLFLLLGNRALGTWPRCLPFLCHYWIPKGEGYKREVPVSSVVILKRETSAISDPCGNSSRVFSQHPFILTLTLLLPSSALSTSFVHPLSFHHPLSLLPSSTLFTPFVFSSFR